MNLRSIRGGPIPAIVVHYADTDGERPSGLVWRHLRHRCREDEIRNDTVVWAGYPKTAHVVPRGVVAIRAEPCHPRRPNHEPPADRVVYGPRANTDESEGAPHQPRGQAPFEEIIGHRLPALAEIVQNSGAGNDHEADTADDAQSVGEVVEAEGHSEQGPVEESEPWRRWDG